MRVSVLVVVSAMVLSGCTAGLEPSTAKAGISTAESAVGKYLSDPQLVSIGGIEPFSHIIDEEFEARVYLDSAQGDGRSPLWAYMFIGEEGVAGALVGPGGSLIADGIERGADWYEDEFPVLPAKFIDSDDAARALTNHPDWPESSESTSVGWDLGGAPPVWNAVMFHDVDAYAYTYGTVDAISGEVIEVVHEDWSEYAEPEWDEEEWEESEPSQPPPPRVEPRPGSSSWMPPGIILAEESGSVTAGVNPGAIGPLCLTGCQTVDFYAWGPGNIVAELSWGISVNDFDMFLYNSDGEEIARSSTQDPSERLEVTVEPDNYTLLIVPWVAVVDDWEAIVVTA